MSKTRTSLIVPVTITLVLSVGLLAGWADQPAVRTAGSADRTANGKRCDQHHPHECAKLRARVHKLQAAVEWQKHARRAEVRRVLNSVRGAQPFAYSAKLAHAACLTFSNDPARCRPPIEMLTVGRCESGLQNHDPNPVSTADGWLQYLDSTWRHQTVARQGFSLYDPIAVAIATEGMARSGWGAWSASGYCHHLS